MVNSKLKKTKLAGMDFWYRSDDKYIGQRIALGKYEEYETKLLLSQIDSNCVVVDIGANIGYYTILMAQKAKKVFAFEPDRENFEILKKNVEVNNLNNVKLLNKAAGSKKEKLSFYKNNKNYGDGRVYSSKDCRSSLAMTESVDCTRLDDVITEKVNLIKIDTQGWEPAVIEGAKNIITRDSPILFVEYWPKGMIEAKQNGEKMMKFLKTVYKYIWRIDDNINIYQRIGKNILVKNRTGYVDLYMKNELSIVDYFLVLKNINYKNIIKGIIGYGKNK